MLTFESRERRGRRTKHTNLPLLVRRIKMFTQLKTIITHATEIWSMDQQTRERHKRWVRMILTIAQLLFIEAFVVLCTRMAQGIVIRMIRLNQHSSWPIAAPGPSCHLSDELKSPFRCSKVGQSKSGID